MAGGMEGRKYNQKSQYQMNCMVQDLKIKTSWLLSGHVVGNHDRRGENPPSEKDKL